MHVDIVTTTYIYPTAQVLNLSSGGLFIKTNRPLEEDSVVDLKLYFPKSAEPILLQGVVRWVRGDASGAVPPGMGVELMGITPAVAALIDAEIKAAPKNF